jgi:uncharacterized protein with ATP-grasp and redox domains
MSTIDEVVQEEVLRQAVSYLSSEKWGRTAPELGTSVHRIVKRLTKNSDPYKELKTSYNKQTLDLYPRLRQLVDSSEDPLLTAAKIAIAGNAIDFGPRTDIRLEKEVDDALHRRLAENDLVKLKKSVLGCKNVLYLADNAGETLFDRLLVEELVKEDVEVAYVVKGGPILNDATLEDAEASGIDQIAELTTTGSDAMGILFNDCSTSFLREFEASKLVISKGQGNFESLNEVLNKEIYFLLKLKCPIIAHILGYEVGDAILKRHFRNI